MKKIITIFLLFFFLSVTLYSKSEYEVVISQIEQKINITKKEIALYKTKLKVNKGDYESASLYNEKQRYLKELQKNRSFVKAIHKQHKKCLKSEATNKKEQEKFREMLPKFQEIITGLKQATND